MLGLLVHTLGAHTVNVVVAGTRFYLCFKKHILQAPFDRRDLYFFVEGHLAMWVVDSFDELDDSQEDGNPSAEGADAEQETDE